jgi:hypothetical protein
LEQSGLRDFQYLPKWLDCSLASAIKVRGLKYLLKIVKENQLDNNKMLIHALKLVVARLPDGYDQ